MGYVEAWDVTTNTKVWGKKVYTVVSDRKLEGDVQWVFIKSLSIEDNKLMVIDEKDRVYKLDIPVNILKEGNFQLPVSEKQNTMIKVGMVFEEAEKMLGDFGAIETNLSIALLNDGSSASWKCYYFPNKLPVIIIDYEQENQKNIIVGLSLYYEYEHKGHPDNKWLNVEEIDLTNIPFAPK